MDNPFQSPAILSICPGIRGLERGLARAGVHACVAAYVEIEAFAIANLVAAMEAGLLDPSPIWTDAKTFDARPFRGKIHGITAGYPCPGESLAGLRKKHLYEGFIWPAIRKTIAATRPFFCFFENVDDHLTGTYPIVRRSLQNLGYRVEEGIFSADELGAGHERQRLFILALENAYFTSIRNRPTLTDWLPRWKNVQQEHWKECAGWSRSTSVDGISKLGHSNGQRLQSIRQISIPDPQNAGRFQIWTSLAGTSSTLWPARPGEDQYTWEEPRVIEPGMGCTIDGYNFREDLLRALGNSVVEQTAELAFITLLQKHLSNLYR